MQLTTLDLLRIEPSILMSTDCSGSISADILRAGKLSQTRHPLLQLRALSAAHPAVAWHSALPAICPVLQLL